MDKTVNFGDVFLYKGEEYVYFVQDVEKDIIYAGKILDVKLTQTMQRIEQNKTKSGIDLHKSPAYSYVILGSREFERRAVICGGTTVNSIALPHVRLEDDDIANIKEEILNGPAPKALKDLTSLLS